MSTPAAGSTPGPMARPGGAVEAGSYWRLVGVQVRAFSRYRKHSPMGWVGLAADCAAATWLYERRAHPEGQAVCLLGLSGRRVLAAAIAVMLPGIAISLVSRGAGAAVLAAETAIVMGVAVRSLRALPVSLRLRLACWPGAHVFVRSLSSTRAGAGAELLGAVVEEADNKAWSLLLDAGTEALVPYYERFGFVRQGPGVVTRDGTTKVRMLRPARHP